MPRNKALPGTTLGPADIHWGADRTRRRMRLRHESLGLSSPSEITGLVAWYDFSDIASLWKDTARTSAVTADADVVKGVTDKSGTANHLSEATNGPAYKVNIQGGRSALLFNGTSTVLASPNITQAQPFTEFAVMKSSEGAAPTQRYIFGRTGGSIQVYKRNSGNWGYYAGTEIDSNVAADTNSHTIVGRFDSAGATSALYLDGGAAKTVGDPGLGFWDGTSALWIGSDSVNFWDGHIMECLLYTGSLSLANINLIGRYLGTKWGLTWTTAT